MLKGSEYVLSFDPLKMLHSEQFVGCLEKAAGVGHETRGVA